VGNDQECVGVGHRHSVHDYTSTPAPSGALSRDTGQHTYHAEAHECQQVAQSTGRTTVDGTCLARREAPIQSHAACTIKQVEDKSHAEQRCARCIGGLPLDPEGLEASTNSDSRARAAVSGSRRPPRCVWQRSRRSVVPSQAPETERRIQEPTCPVEA